MQKEVANLRDVEIVRLTKENEEVNKEKSKQEKQIHRLEQEKIELEKEIQELKELTASLRGQESEEASLLRTQHEKLIEGRL